MTSVTTFTPVEEFTTTQTEQVNVPKEEKPKEEEKPVIKTASGETEESLAKRMAAVQLKMAELEARRERVEAVQRKSSEYIQRTERLRQKLEERRKNKPLGVDEISESVKQLKQQVETQWSERMDAKKKVIQKNLQKKQEENQ